MSAAQRNVGTQARLSRTAAWISGGGLATLGALGFVPGITTHYAELQVGGYESGAQLFGVFQTSIALNVILLVVGGIGLLMAPNGITARPYLVIAGLFLGVLAGYSAAVGRDTAANILPLDLAGIVLFGAIAAALLVTGVVAHRRERGDPTAE